MSKISDAIGRARAKVASKSDKIMARSCCSLLAPSRQSDGLHGHKLVETVVATGIPCTVRQISGGIVLNEAGNNEVKTHRLTLPVTEQTLGITRRHKILAPGSCKSPEMMFEKPVTQLSDTDVFLTVFCTQVIGYQQPAMT